MPGVAHGADAPGLPLLAWGERRAAVRARRGRRRRLAGFAAFGVAALALPMTLAPRPLLVWNASPSVPIGLYRVEPAARLAPRDTVVVRLPPAARALAARRGYLPAAVPAVKRIAAVAGARVCARGPAILVDGRRVAARLAADRRGRPLPWWTGCHGLAPGEIFLLVPDSADSFDGRYFGPSPRAAVIGRAHLLWASDPSPAAAGPFGRPR